MPYDPKFLVCDSDQGLHCLQIILYEGFLCGKISLFKFLSDYSKFFYDVQNIYENFGNSNKAIIFIFFVLPFFFFATSKGRRTK